MFVRPILELYCFFLSDFDDTAKAAIKLLGPSRRNCTCFLSFFPGQFKWMNLKADMPPTPLCPIVRQVGEPVLHVSISKTVVNTTSVLVSGSQASTCIFLTQTFYYKSLLENLGRSYNFSDLPFCFEALSFYGLQGLSLKSVL